MEFKYKVYYSEKACHGLRTFTGTVDNWHKTPMQEVLVIVQTDKEHGRKLVAGGDYYIWEGEKVGWVSCDKETKEQYMARLEKEKRYLLGVMVDGDTWNRAMKEARLDQEFPTQTATHVYEPKEYFKREEK